MIQEKKEVIKILMLLGIIEVKINILFQNSVVIGLIKQYYAR